MKRKNTKPVRRNMVIIILAAAVVLLLESCWVINQKIGSGDVVSKDIFIEHDFTGIVSNTPGQIILTDSPAPYISLVGDDNILEELEFSYSEHMLFVKVSPDVSFSSFTLFIYIPVGRLTRLESLGAGDFSTKTMLKTGDLELMLKGSGNLRLQLDAGTVNSCNRGSGDIILSGRCEQHNAAVDGSGDILAAGFEARFASAVANSAGNIEIFSSDNLSARTAGKGLISYSGKPLHTELSYSVPGSISEM